MERFLKYFDEPVSRAELIGILGKMQTAVVIKGLLQKEWIECKTPKFSLTPAGRLVWQEYTRGTR